VDGWRVAHVRRKTPLDLGGKIPVHLEEVVSRAWKAEMVGRGVEVLVRGVEDQNAEFDLCVFPQKFAVI